MKVNQETSSLSPTLSALKLRVHQYLASQINRNIKDIDSATVRDGAGKIFDTLFPIIMRPSISPASIKGICIRAKKKDVITPYSALPYAAYLHACSIILGHASWHTAMTDLNKSSMITNEYYQKFDNHGLILPEETSIPNATALETLAKGTHVTWANLKKILSKLSDTSLHSDIDSLLMEMQHAVGIEPPIDPRGDMIFAVFMDDTEDNSYFILGEKYRPPSEVEGPYKTVMVNIKTYSMSNRIMEIRRPKGYTYAPFTIKQLLQDRRAEYQAVTA